jgi:phosphoglycerate dehydrogenase-like enzyme
VSKEELFASSDFVSLHIVLSEATRGIVGRTELLAMKPTAYLINTSRGDLIDERALLEALSSQRIGGAALDVFSTEPLPSDHPIRALRNVVLTPHIGYFTRQQLARFYGEAAEKILAFIKGEPVSSVNLPNTNE